MKKRINMCSCKAPPALGTDQLDSAYEIEVACFSKQ
jgi:hypothetical protein